MNYAHISVLHKSGKDPFNCSSYRPISLLDHDYKIITKLLAKRLESNLPKLINLDQSGFIKGRYAADNIRLLNTINNLDNSRNPSLLLSLDAEKAFDRVAWNFLFSVLHSFNVGLNFIEWIKSIYKNPKAAVITNDAPSEYFSLTRGTRQGCPLSPLLFAMVVEPLASCVRDNINIKGLKIEDNEHKILLYADDIIVYITDPENSTSHLYSTIKQLGKYSGYKINFNKSNACLLHMTPTENMYRSYPFQWMPGGFKYLGINITPKLDNLCKENYTPLIDKIKADFCKWSTLPLSLLGRINVIIMNVLPRFIFLFQMLPCYLSAAFFKPLNKDISKCIWSNKKPRISFTNLMKPENMGGLGLPNLQYYFWSAQLCNLISWSLGETGLIVGPDGGHFF
uniref:ribonuclease H n=1 Tax=Labrus bergylta TaxID=56723 RepID=A0A3Q3FAB3_9LABR